MDGGHFQIITFRPTRYFRRSRRQITATPLPVVVWAISWTKFSSWRHGSPRQFHEMTEKIRQLKYVIEFMTQITNGFLRKFIITVEKNHEV